MGKLSEKTVEKNHSMKYDKREGLMHDGMKKITEKQSEEEEYGLQGTL